MSSQPARRASMLAVGTGLVAVGFSLRTLMAGLPPMERSIGHDLSLSAGWVGVLTTLPVLCMGLFAPPSARIGARLGSARAITLGTLLIVVGNLMRGLGSHVAALYAGTVVAGVGIAVVGTLLPGLVKGVFPPERAGLVTGLQMLAMMAGAATASALAEPLAAALGGWPRSLAVWAAVAVVGLLLWLPVDRATLHHLVPDSHPADTEHGLPWRSTTAWLVALFLAAQSWQFYSCLAWLSPTYVEHHWSATRAGYLLALFTGAQLVSGLVAPWLTDRVHDWRVLLVAAGILGMSGEAGVALAPTAAPLLWTALLGLGQGSAFALGLVLLVRYAVSPRASARFTAMAFLVSYGLASLGPTVMGAVHDATGGFRAVWVTLLAVGLVQMALSLRARPSRRRVG